MSGDQLPGGDHEAIDELARRAGAAVRRPAPDGLAGRVRAARRRQQLVRSGIAAGTALAVVAVVVTVSLSDDDRTVTPSVTTAGSTTPVDTTEATTSTAPQSTSTSTEPTTDSTLPLPSLPPLGWDADGVPDVLYAYRTDPKFDVVDASTFEVIDTVTVNWPPMPQEVARSRSGTVGYAFPYDEQGDADACRQLPTERFITGADVSGLPARIAGFSLSADGSTVVFNAADCPPGITISPEGVASEAVEIVVLVADADDPSGTVQELARFDGAAEVGFDAQLSFDGSYVRLMSFDVPVLEGPSGTRYRFYDTSSRELVGTLGWPAADGLPHAACTDFSPRFVSSTTVAYTALCDEGVAVVVRDLTTGAGIDVLQPEFAGRTYETLVAMGLEVDAGTFSSAADAWYLLCGGREVRQSNGSLIMDPPGSFPCFFGHGSEPMREVPVAARLVFGPPPA